MLIKNDPSPKQGGVRILFYSAVSDVNPNTSDLFKGSFRALENEIGT